LPPQTTTPTSLFPHTTNPHTTTLSLHDALPIYLGWPHRQSAQATPRDLAGLPLSGPAWIADGTRRRPIAPGPLGDVGQLVQQRADRKSTRLNSSHEWISYAVFCLKKKKIYVTTS